MERIRVLLGTMPQMLREMIRSAIDDANDMSVVGSIEPGADVTSSLARTDADVLVVSVHDALAAATVAPILYSRPRLTVLAIGANGRDTVLHELRPHQLALGDVSASGLLEAIRTSVHEKVR